MTRYEQLKLEGICVNGRSHGAALEGITYCAKCQAKNMLTNAAWKKKNYEPAAQRKARLAAERAALRNKQA